jgi:hypothetical protein
VGKKVPLVVYVNDERKEIGEAEVEPDGRVEMRVTDDTGRRIVLGNLTTGTMSFSPAAPLILPHQPDTALRLEDVKGLPQRSSLDQLRTAYVNAVIWE